MSEARTTKRRMGLNDAGYEVPRFNLETKRLAWIKEMRSAGSRAAAVAVFNSARGRAAVENSLGPDRVLISMYEVEIADLPTELNGLRVVQLSDIHHGPWLPLEYVERIVQKANELKPDVIALTGDYVCNSERYIEPVAEILAGLAPSIGTVAVMGNHDWWEGAEQIKLAFRRKKIPLIDNSRRIVTLDRTLARRNGEGLCLAGVGDPWAHEVNFDRALAHVPRHMPRIMLSHNPETAEDPRLLASDHRIDLMLSGHTHGGQVCFPNKRTPMLPRMRKNKYAKGLIMGPRCPVYVCRGIGTAGVPLRMGADPEIAVFDLVRAGAPRPGYVFPGTNGTE